MALFTGIRSEGTKERPTISIIDFGEGQHPKDFPKTFLSIGGTNKVKINFAHGVYNQGGSAALKFCGTGYQLILSRRAPGIPSAHGADVWGFTIVRERYEPGSKAEQYEYCVVKDAYEFAIPEIPFEPLHILPGDDGVFESGTFVRLYGYVLRNPNLFITGQLEKQLAREVNKRYFSMPLPIELNELRTHLKGWSKQNEKTRIYGLWRLLKKQVGQKGVIRAVLTLKAELGIFGQRNIELVVLNDESEQGQSYRNQSEKIFLTINGQAQHTETVNFLKTECFLPDLAPYMIIHVDLSNAGYQANKVFQTARSGVIAIPEYDYFHERLIQSIKDDETLIGLNREYKERKLKNAQPEDKELSRYIGKLVGDNPFLASYLKIGNEISTETPKGPTSGFTGKNIPTLMEIVGDSDKQVPYNRYARVRIKTDAVDDYLTRQQDKGEFKWTPSKLVQISQYSLHEGFIPLRVNPVAGVKPGETDVVTFELTRPNLDSLNVQLKVTVGEFEEPKVNPHGKDTSPTKLALKLPERKYIPKEQWISRNWGGQDIAEVEEDQDGITVYINKEPDVLVEFPKRNPRFGSGDMVATIHKRFFASVYLYALALFFELRDDKEKRAWAIPMALKAVSKFILDLAFSSRATEKALED